MIPRALGQKLARLSTNAVVAKPQLWRIFRGLTRRQFQAMAPRWDAIRMDDHLAAYEAALGAIPTPPRRALDLGTGTGDGALAIARRFPETEVVGVDLAAAMVSAAVAKLPVTLEDRVSFRVADASRLPFDDESFDLVAHANMIPFFDELARVLSPGGYALFGFSGGAQTPIYVPPERLRQELAARSFEDFVELTGGRGTALLARKRDAASADQ